MRTETVTAPPGPILLIVSDDPGFLAIHEEMAAILENSGWTLSVKSCEDYESETCVLSAEPDCILLDSAALKAGNKARFESIQNRFHGKHVPFLALADLEESSLLSDQLAIADEIVLRRLGSAELAARVIRHVEKRRKLMELMTIDLITGAYTGKYLLIEFQKQLNELKRSHEPFTIVYLELDELLSVYNTQGYAAAETMMKQFVGFFQQKMRPTDSISRFGNEGFILILPLTVKEDAIKFIKRMMQLFSETPIPLPSAELQTTFSARVAEIADASLSPKRCLAMMPFDANESGGRGKSSLIEAVAVAGDSCARKFKIAIIDDDRIIRELLSQQLQDIGDELYEVEIRSYADGEAYFNDPWHRQNERFIVIIDRIMPKMDGLEVLQTIRSNYDRRRYMCVMLTSRDSETEIAQAIQRGANDYVKKPFSLKELRARLRRLMRGMR